MRSTPKVSIVIPVYNGSDYLSQAIDSALAQTYSAISEIIVVNDGSNDGGATEDIALSYGDKVRYFFKENGGVASALNTAIHQMRGDYFSWLSHDDLYYPDKVESQVQSLLVEESPKTILYGDYAVFWNTPDEVREIRLAHLPPDRFRYFLTTMNALHGCTLLVPKSAFDECGLFSERLRTTQDYDLWFRLAGKYQFRHIPKLLVKARQHAEQGSIRMSSIALAECDKLLTGFVEKLSETELAAEADGSISLAYANISACMRSRGFRNAARTASVYATKHLGNGSIRDSLKSAVVLLRAKWVNPVLANGRKLLAALRRRGRLLQLIKGRLLPHWDANLNADLREKFVKIYSSNAFGGTKSRSGEGSSMVQTAEIRRVLPQVIREYGIETFMDAPCGDYYWMKEARIGVKRYIGVDIVDVLVQNNQVKFGNDSTTFLCLNLVEDKLPKADLILCRDCLVHLTFEDIHKALANFQRSGSTYLLTTTFIGRKSNKDLVGADIWRPLNLRLPPFSFPSPLRLIDERCSEYGGQFADKHLGLWLLSDINRESVAAYPGTVMRSHASL